MKVCIRRVPLEDIRRWTNAYFASAEKRAKSVSLVEQQAEEDAVARCCHWGNFLGYGPTAKTHEKLLRTLPAGVYGTSNLFSGGEEIFSERLGPLETRETAWRRATHTGANNRLCRLLWTEEDVNGLSLANHVPQAQR